jgi:DNA-binding NarL/FixJ family response regulator
MSSPIRVLIEDYEELVRAGLVMIVDHQSDLEVTGEASDGAAAVEQARSLRPDVVLLDLRMPNLDGVGATRRIAELDLDPPPRVLVLTTFDDDESVYASLQAGASGFLLKDAPPRNLAEAIRVVASGESLLAPKVTRGIIERFVAQHPADASLQKRAELLSDREVELLRAMDRGLTNAEIGERLFVSEATVKSHVSHILTKLGARDRAQAVALGYEASLIRPGSLEDETSTAG